MSDKDWASILQEVADAEPCPPSECESCGFPELCRYLRACAASDAE